jgi:ubiquinone/menaquinone biosynthesis C-methylase UbiE
MQNLKKKWNNVHKNSVLRTKYPNESVVRFMNSDFPRSLSSRRKISILDIGCGSGRHVKLFAENRFQVFGIDFSKSAIFNTKNLLRKNKLRAELKCSDMHNLPFKDNYFDGVLSFGVFYYSDSKGMKKSIKEMYRVLKKGGTGFINIRSTNDYRYGKGKKIENNTYILNIKDTNELDLKIHFLNRNQLRNYFKQFKKIEIEKNEFSYKNVRMLNSDWLVRVIK